MASKKSKNWGGKRQNAGRKKSDKPKNTIVIRIDELLLPAIKLLKERQQSGEAIESLLDVTDNQDSINELEQFKKANLELVLQKDSEHSKLIKLQAKVNLLESTNSDLKAQLEALKHQTYDCQALKKDGTRCTRPAKVKTSWHGVQINTCVQHAGEK